MKKYIVSKEKCNHKDFYKGYTTIKPHTSWDKCTLCGTKFPKRPFKLSWGSDYQGHYSG